MFSFHKPKVYRSSTGCCICKAKSSSSRFTDSKKYEEDFIKCFLLTERRTGEICNACVLLVKRWKKLPLGSTRNWRHVVDARAGPGIKSLTKFKLSKNKKKSKEIPEKLEKILKKSIYQKDGDREQSPAMSDDTEEDLAGPGSKGSSRAGSPADSDADREVDVSSFIDLTYFKRKNVCCGVIFVGMMGEVLIEPSLLKPCLGCLASRQREQLAAAAKSLANVAGSSPSHSSASASPCHSSASTSPVHSVESVPEVVKTINGGGKAFSDSSSDSGYDEFNQGLISENKIKCQTLLDKPVKVQIPKPEAILPTTVPLRLTNLGGTKMPIKLLGKPVALLSSAKLSLSNATQRPVETVLAVRPPPQRQSLAN